MKKTKLYNNLNLELINVKLLLLLYLLTIILFFNNFVFASWWNNSYNYKVPINISTNSGITESNFQVKIILNSSNVGSNFNWSRSCNDIRFINQSDNFLLNYFIENCSSFNQNATIWIKIPINISSTNITIDMYYGNNIVSNLSNGTLTFDFFDDFSGNLSKWVKEKNPGNININNGYLNISGGITSSPYGHSSIGSSQSYNNFLNGIIEGDLYLSNNGIGEIGFRGNFSSNTGYKARADARIGQGVSYLKPPYFGWDFLSGCSLSGTSVNNNVWSNFQIIVNGTLFTINIDGQSNTCSDNQYTMPGEISLQNHYGSFSLYDNIRVRKYFDGSIKKYFGNEFLMPLSINFVNPTPLNNSIINSSGNIFVNITTSSLSNFSTFIDFNQNLLNYLNFENISGSTVYDYSSYLNNGTLNNGAIINNTVKIRGNYLILDGINDYVKSFGVPVNTSLGAKTTVEFWMYWDGTSGQMPFSWDNGYYDLWFNGGCFGFNTFNSNVLGIPSFGLANSWHHIVAVFYNGIANPTTNELYIDTIKQNIYNCFGYVSSSRIVTTTPRISGHLNNYNFKGKIDEFKIWNGILTQKEINNSYYSKFNYYRDYTNLNDGNYSFKACSINYNGEFKCTKRRFVEIIYNLNIPKVNYVNPTPLNGDNVVNSVIINITINESNLDSVILIWNDTKENMSCTGISPVYNCNSIKTNLGINNNYTFQVKVNNTLGFIKILDERTIFSVSKPELFLIQPPSPIQNQIINNSYALINFTLNDSTNLSSYIDFNNNLKLYYNFEDFSGQFVYDKSSYNLLGELKSGANIYNVDGIRGDYVLLDGANDYILVNGVNINTSLGAKNTFEFWMYWNGGNSQMPMGFIGSNYDLWFNAGNFGFNTGNGDIYGISSVGLSNSWHHVVAVFYNGQVNSTNNKLYIDGVEQVISQKIGISQSRSVTNNFLISGWGADLAYKFGGKIDEFKVWEGELSPELINLSYNSKKINYQFNYSNLILGLLNNYTICSINFFGVMNCSNEINFKYFEQIPFKDNISIIKNITNINTNQYLINLKLFNYLNESKNISIIDFVDSKFNVGSFSLSYNLTNIINGFYNGSIYVWNLTLNPYENLTINYSIVGLGDYKLNNNFLVGIE